jgi:hypothetical protein
MKVLLVEPSYYTQYPPLGLLKLASYYRSRGCDVKLVRGVETNLNFNADIIEITSLFTYAWKPVHEAVAHYHKLIPDAKITVGGIYASILPNRVRRFFPFVNIHQGLHEKSERYMPAYDLLSGIDKWKSWNKSILFTTRGCIRKCPFCVVPQLEGKLKVMIEDIQDFDYPGHDEVILWDNNLLASPQWNLILEKLSDVGLNVDFNQGLDARLIDEKKAAAIAELRTRTVRMAYDNLSEKNAAHNAVKVLGDAGVRKRKVLFYVLYNFFSKKGQFTDTPEIFLEILRDIGKIGCSSFPMRYEPLNSLNKNKFVSPLWTQERLEAIAEARRVIGFGGAFPPYEGLVNKFCDACDFDEAFKLRPYNRSQKKSVESISASIIPQASSISSETCIT